MKFRKRHIPAAIGVLLVAGLVMYAFWPRPLEVDVAEVTRGPMRVTVDDDGRTRIKERYTISAPLAGRLRRIPLDPGDNAIAGETLLAVIEPRDPELLDARTEAEAEARVEAAQAALQQAEAQVESAAAQLALARSEAEKLKRLAAQGAATAEERDDAILLEQVREQELNAARFAQQIAAFQLKLAEAALLRSRPPGKDDEHERRLTIRAPCNGRVLRVFEESEGFVTAGTPLLEFGDPTELEAVVDVLSADAVRIEPGDEVVIDHWGGEKPLRGRVRVVEPSGFTKVSSLGVEEQRVNVIIDFVDPPVARADLGDGYRIEARIIVWQRDDAVRVPTSALFRRGEQWAVFRIDAGGRVAVTEVTIGQNNGVTAEVIAGLEPGDRVIVHPGDKVTDGAAVKTNQDSPTLPLMR